jgi:hypothetical protein
VSKHSQTRANPLAGIVPFLPLVLMGLGAILTAVAWFYLVGAAIDFGVVAVQGEPRAWLFTLGASVGAVVCLMLMLTLVARALRTLGFISDYKPRRAAARRR